jgi:hypothetical protein
MVFLPNLSVNLRACLCGVVNYASAQALERLDLGQKSSFLDWKHKRCPSFATVCYGRALISRWMMVWVAVFFCLLSSGLTDQTHADVSPADPVQSSWFVDMQRFQKGAHASFKCEDCHGTMIEDGHTHPDPNRPDFLKQSATRQFDYRRCQKCHKLPYQRYLKGQHAKALKEETALAGKKKTPAKETQAAKEKYPAPTCGECHSAHYDPAGMSRVAVGARMTSRCGRCHQEYSESYLDNIHGKLGVNLADKASAFCTDCHGAHHVVTLEKKQEALIVCQRCHPEAASKFTQFVIHATVNDSAAKESPKSNSIVWIRRVQTVAIAVVALSLIFFFGHAILWLLREKHEKLRKH